MSITITETRLLPVRRDGQIGLSGTSYGGGGGGGESPGVHPYTWDGTDFYIPGNIRALGGMEAYSNVSAPLNWWDAMPIATTVAGGNILGGIRVGAYLTIDPVTGVLNGQAGGTGGGGLWGDITGDITDQSDLIGRLDLKANLASPTFTGTLTVPDINIRSATDAYGYVGISKGDASNAGYVSWWRPNTPTRYAYMGYGNGACLNLTLENTATFNISGGNTGFGTTTAAQKVHTYHSTNGEAMTLLLENAYPGTSVQSALGFAFNTADADPAYLTKISSNVSNRGVGTNAADLRFYTTTAGTIGERMRISEAGNVLIGQTTGAEKLCVTGNGLFTGDIICYG